MHMLEGSRRYREGQTVARGVEIGKVGNTGASRGAHLHFEIKKDGGGLNPTSVFTVNARNPRSSAAPPQPKYKDTEECKPCIAAAEISQLTDANIEQRRLTGKAISERLERALRRFNNLRAIFRYLEISPDIMVSNIARDSNGNESNAFGAAPGALSIKANMEMPGIAGLRIGELFWMDRMPLFYRAFGAFQTMTIEDEVSIMGWTTKMSARFNYLGTAWKKSIVNLIRTGDI
jgi:hypothetical protein